MDDVGVYVHVPFCERICPYCDFPVVAARRPDEARYVDALLAELARRGRPGPRLASLYLGGGTPSLLSPASVARIVGAVRAVFGDDDVEVTLEMNPSTTECERLPGFRAAGVNRLSVGIQSFDDGVLKRLGRAHRADAGRDALRAARAAGFENLSVDLMFGAPGQGLAELEEDLEEVVAFAPEHVSAYELTLEPGTPFARARERLRLPGEDVVVAMMERVAARLEAAGLARYEISSYARPGRESRHNRRYWERRPVLGLGMGAWSTGPRARCANPRELAAYLAGEEGREELLGEGTARSEAIFLALRTARGLDAQAFAQEFGRPPRAFHADAIDSLRGAGLLDEDVGGDLRLTPRGRLLADHVASHFVLGY
jgi:oxygen-independent coproporphyrinogen-3 oxidase